MNTILPPSQRKLLYQHIDNSIISETDHLIELLQQISQYTLVKQANAVIIPPNTADFSASEIDESICQDPDTIILCRHMLHSMPAPPSITYIKLKANANILGTYNVRSDQIRIGRATQFTTLSAYFHVLFHELVHSTRHPSRLDRPCTILQTVPEEIIAELGALYLSAVAGTMPQILPHALQYLFSYLTRYKAAKGDFLLLAVKAQAAAEYILSGNERTPCTMPTKLFQGSLF